jgi:hypothetical protein
LRRHALARRSHGARRLDLGPARRRRRGGGAQHGSFGSEAQALSDAAVVRKQLQSARIESADFIPIAPLRTAQGDR